MKRNKSNFLNFIFSMLVLLNVFLFLFVLPISIHHLFESNEIWKNFYNYSLGLILILGGIAFSYKSFFYGINLDHLDNQIGKVNRYGAVYSGGDKEFFTLMSKPLSFFVLIFLVVVQSILLKELYGF